MLFLVMQSKILILCVTSFAGWDFGKPVVQMNKTNKLILHFTYIIFSVWFYPLQKYIMDFFSSHKTDYEMTLSKKMIILHICMIIND